MHQWICRHVGPRYNEPIDMRAVVVYPPMVLPTSFPQSCLVLVKGLQTMSTRRRGCGRSGGGHGHSRGGRNGHSRGRGSRSRGRGGGRDRGGDRQYCRTDTTCVLLWSS